MNVFQWSHFPFSSVKFIYVCDVLMGGTVFVVQDVKNLRNLLFSSSDMGFEFEIQLLQVSRHMIECTSHDYIIYGHTSFCMNKFYPV